MEQIRDGRRNILVHPNATVDDLPVEGFPGLPSVANEEPFTPNHVDEPQLYPGDVIVGVSDGGLDFAELIYDKIDEGVLVLSLETGRYELHDDEEFSSRFYRGEIHVYDNVVSSTPDWEIEFDESKLEYPETGRAR